jgi:hypothetical protein
MPEMIEVTEAVRAARAVESERAAYDARQAARMGLLRDELGNPVTVQQIIEAHARGEEMRAAAERDLRENRRIREQEEREAARVKAEQQYQAQKEQAARTKEEQRAIWVNRGLDPDRFESAWPQLEIAIARGHAEGDDLDARIRRQKLRDIGYNRP